MITTDANGRRAGASRRRISATTTATTAASSYYRARFTSRGMDRRSNTDHRARR